MSFREVKYIATVYTICSDKIWTWLLSFESMIIFFSYLVFRKYDFLQNSEFSIILAEYYTAIDWMILNHILYHILGDYIGIN